MQKQTTPRYFVTGGAGFIGAHLVNHLLDTTDASVTVYDNFSNGRSWAYGDRIKNPRLQVIAGDAQDLGRLQSSIRGHDVVYHFASNADIARAAQQPDIDFWNGTYLTHNVLEAMRKTDVKRIIFTSGSGVYGEVPPTPIPEDYPKLIPISTYGACKLACETLISAYSHMFDMFDITGTVFRFANVVGPHQTHGVAYDFLRRLAQDPKRLLIYGDGQQSKPYIHVEDVIAAMRLLEKEQKAGYAVYNVGSQDHLTVREVADILVQKMNLKDVAYEFTGGARGWRADVPVYRLDTTKIRGTGWANKRNSRQAVEAAVEAMLEDLKRGNITPAP
jgi:UDP-glucose 4-epimerase